MELLISFKTIGHNVSIVEVGTQSFVKSYDTLVATIDYMNEAVKPIGYWSRTTSKHINVVAKQLGFKVIK